jgi:hypothetical protein
VNKLFYLATYQTQQIHQQVVSLTLAVGKQKKLALQLSQHFYKLVHRK